MINELLAAIDRKDADGFAALLAPDCIFRFGNQPEVVGRDNIREFVAGFFASIRALSHRVNQSWPVPGGDIFHGQVTYWREDGSELRVPFANILKTGETGISEYLVFVDTSSLYS